MKNTFEDVLEGRTGVTDCKNRSRFENPVGEEEEEEADINIVELNQRKLKQKMELEFHCSI